MSLIEHLKQLWRRRLSRVRWLVAAVREEWRFQERFRQRVERMVHRKRQPQYGVLSRWSRMQFED